METPPAWVADRRARTGLWRLLRWLRWGLVVALAVAAGVAVYAQRHQIAAAGGLLGQLRWDWVVVALVFEGGSMVVFARLQRWLLHSGAVDLGLGPMVQITLAGNSMSVTLPGGAAWAAAFAYEQLRRRGADRTLAGWVILVAGGLSSLALFGVFAAGVQLAGDTGPVTSLRVVVLVLAAVPLALGAGAIAVRRGRTARGLAQRVGRMAVRHLPHGRQLGRAGTRFLERLGAVQPTPGVWATTFGLAVANWLLDCGALVASIKALGLPVPWSGLLVAYSLAQISASLPITPGGIGVVEGSLTFALVSYGMADRAAVASALLYRVVSFWMLIPIGWSVWGSLQMRQRRRAVGRRAPAELVGDRG